MTRLISTISGPWLHVASIAHLHDDDILHVYDAFDENHLKRLLEKKGHPEHVVQDSYTFYQGHIPSNLWCADLWLGTEIMRFQDIKSKALTTNHAVNFIVNKKQINRFLLLKLIEFFKISHDYTWSGVDNQFDMSQILTEIESLGHSSPWDIQTKSHFLRPVEIKPRWISHPDEIKNTAYVGGYGTNRWTWDNGIADIVSRTAVSLISESVRFEKAMHFSEKTLYAMLGQTLPIWIGGYLQADEWEKFGFDVFRDIINHDYQYHETLVERCWYAFYDNLPLLSDLSKLKKLRLDLAPRLEKNFHLIKNNVVQRRNLDLIQSWPIPVRQAIKPVLKYFFPNHLTE